MCVAYPARVVAMEGDGMALAELSGRPRRVLLTLVGGPGQRAGDGDRVLVGDWLLVQSGIALARLSRHEAAERIRELEAAFEAVTDA